MVKMPGYEQRSQIPRRFRAPGVESIYKLSPLRLLASDKGKPLLDYRSDCLRRKFR